MMSSATLGSATIKVEILNPIERIKRYGLECVGPSGDGIAFRAGQWQPGGEYVQKLIFRNVSSVVKKFKYKLPTSRFFSMAYPEVIVLSPGMFQEVDVIFRPLELSPYDDFILVRMQEGLNSGGFHVPVRAMISKLVVTTPFGVDLGFCTARQTTRSVAKRLGQNEMIEFLDENSLSDLTYVRQSYYYLHYKLNLVYCLSMMVMRMSVNLFV